MIFSDFSDIVSSFLDDSTLSSNQSLNPGLEPAAQLLDDSCRHGGPCSIHGSLEGVHRPAVDGLSLLGNIVPQAEVYGFRFGEFEGQGVLDQNPNDPNLDSRYFCVALLEFDGTPSWTQTRHRSCSRLGIQSGLAPSRNFRFLQFQWKGLDVGSYVPPHHHFGLVLLSSHALNWGLCCLRRLCNVTWRPSVMVPIDG